MSNRSHRHPWPTPTIAARPTGKSLCSEGGNPKEITQGFSRPELLSEVERIRQAFPTPEDINDHPDTAPSARLRKLFPRYSKPFFGTLISRRIGLADMRAECKHFGCWVKTLEAL